MGTSSIRGKGITVKTTNVNTTAITTTVTTTAAATTNTNTTIDITITTTTNTTTNTASTNITITIKARKQKARQKAVRANANSRRLKHKVTSSDANNDTNSNVVPDVKLGLGQVNNTNTKGNVKTNNDSDDSGWDDSDDNSDSSGFDDDDDDTDNKINSQPRNNVTTTTKTTTSIPSKNESLEKEVETLILSWARGKDIGHLIQTLSLVYSGELPDLGPSWLPSSSPPTDPSEIRKGYLKVIRYCHPDKLPHSVSMKQKIEATKLFSLLADAYSYYKHT